MMTKKPSDLRTSGLHTWFQRKFKERNNQMTVNNSVLTPLLVYFSSLTHEESRQMKQTQQRHKSPTNFFINFKFRPSQSRQFAQPVFFFYLGRLLYHKLGVSLVTLDFRENSVAIRGIREKNSCFGKPKQNLL